MCVGLYTPPMDRWMTPMFIAVALAEALSLAFLLFASYEYRRLLRRHAAFFRAIGGNGQHERVEHASHILFWIYVAATLAVTAFTMFLFVAQPHIL